MCRFEFPKKQKTLFARFVFLSFVRRKLFSSRHFFVLFYSINQFAPSHELDHSRSRSSLLALHDGKIAKKQENAWQSQKTLLSRSIEFHFHFLFHFRFGSVKTTKAEFVNIPNTESVKLFHNDHFGSDV